MARIARVVATGLPHHITQRGTNRQPVFTTDRSREVYLALLREHSRRHHLRILAYCLMTNHIHLVAIPEQEDSLHRTMRYVHGRFAQYINAELLRCGHLWQNRYYSCPIEPSGVEPVIAYVELNPVRAGLVQHAAEFAWSSAAFHVGMATDRFDLLEEDRRGSAIGEGPSWTQYLLACVEQGSAIRQATFTGLPLGSEEFVKELEMCLGRKLRRQKPGPKPKPEVTTHQMPMFG